MELTKQVTEQINTNGLYAAIFRLGQLTERQRAHVDIHGKPSEDIQHYIDQKAEAVLEAMQAYRTLIDGRVEYETGATK